MGKLIDRIADFIKPQQTDKRYTQERGNEIATAFLIKNALTKDAYLPLATEFYSQGDDCQFKTDRDCCVTLGDVLVRIFDLHKKEMTGLFVVSFKNGIQEGKNITEPDPIWNFDLCKSMVTKENVDSLYNQVTLNVAFAQSGDMGCILLHLRACGGNKDVRFIRISCMKVAPAFEADVTPMENDQPEAFNFLLAWNLTDQQERKKQIEKKADQVIEKYNSGKQLDDKETSLIARFAPEVEWLYSWGSEAFDRKCYLEAIVYLENAYQILKERYLTDNLTNEGMTILAHVCYLIGYSYIDLGLYEKAFYYLDIIKPIGNIKYNIEYINCLVNSKDIRVLPVISEELEHLSELKDEETPERINSYCHFLLRRQAQALIDCGKLDEAEKQFKELLQYGEQTEYIENELAYIKSLREENRSKQ